MTCERGCSRGAAAQIPSISTTPPLRRRPLRQPQRSRRRSRRTCYRILTPLRLPASTPASSSTGPEPASCRNSSMFRTIGSANGTSSSLKEGLHRASNLSARDATGASPEPDSSISSSHTRGKSPCSPSRRDRSALTRDFLDSLVGLRGYALAQECRVVAHQTPEELLRSAANRSASPSTSSAVSQPSTLYTYPAQCNATGARLGLRFAAQIKRADPEARVLVDAAAYSSTSVLDLGTLPPAESPDFVVASVYKILVRFQPRPSQQIFVPV